MHEVLISYSTKDKKWADAACSVLEARGIRCWIAPRDILPGREWGEAIVDAIDGCKLMVLIFSASANASPQVRREVERAISKGRTVVPCRIENVMPAGSMEFALGNTHWLDIFTPPVERQMNRVAESVEALLARERAASGNAQVPRAAIPSISRRESRRDSANSRRNWRVKDGLIAAVGCVIILGLAACALFTLRPGKDADQSPVVSTSKPANAVRPAAAIRNLPAAATTGAPAPATSAAKKDELARPAVPANPATPDPERVVAEAVLALGGRVAVRVDGFDKPINPGGALPLTPFELVEVDLRKQRELTDSALEPLEHVSRLRSVFLDDDPRIGDAALAHLRSQTNLQKLGLSGTRVTDAGMAVVERFRHLELLAIGGTKLTDEALSHLKGLTELQTLWLGNGPQVTDAGLAHLQNLTQMRGMIFYGAPLNGSGFQYLKGMTHLEGLALNRTRLTDEGLAHLARLHGLRSLNIAKTRITDAGLQYLKGMTNLERLDLSLTTVTPNAVEELRKAIPACRVTANDISQ
jgi:hypothetical protein